LGSRGLQSQDPAAAGADCGRRHARQKTTRTGKSRVVLIDSTPVVPSLKKTGTLALIFVNIGKLFNELA
jgi:hypothetical protein